MKKIQLILTALCASAASAQTTHGAMMEYTTRAAFDAASPGMQTLDFEGIAGVNSYVFYGTSHTFSTATFESPDGRLFVLDYGWYNSNGPATSYLNVNGGATHGLDVTLPAGTA